MQKQMTDEQIAQARTLRAEGKTYAEIKAAIGADVAHDTIRAHCADVPVPTKEGERVRTRTDKVRQGKDGRVIRPFTEDDDKAIITWSNIMAEPNKFTADPNELTTDGKPLIHTSTMADLARQLDRKRHSVAARIATLKKHGKL